MSTFTPKISRRGIYYFAEVATAPGPQAITVTGDNSVGALFGREWLLVLARDTSLLHLHQESSTADGTWVEVTADLPPAFDVPLEVDARRITFAFDQTARIIIAYETGGIVKVTRWDASLNSYVQNVSFAGHDPAILMDATLADPRGYPNLADDGWSVREAYFAGIRVLFEWIPDASIRENPITDSDVVLFYLSTDRTQVYARVQRQLYATPLLIHTFDAPVVLDRVVALAGRYQLLIGDAVGDPLTEMLISDPYLGDFIISPQATSGAAANVVPEGVRVENTTLEAAAAIGITVGVVIENVAVTGDTLFADDSAAATGQVAPEDVVVTGDTLMTSDENGMNAGMAVDDPINVVQTDIPKEAENALDTSVEPETIRVQTV